MEEVVKQYEKLTDGTWTSGGADEDIKINVIDTGLRPLSSQLPHLVDIAA